MYAGVPRWPGWPGGGCQALAPVGVVALVIGPASGAGWPGGARSRA